MKPYRFHQQQMPQNWRARTQQRIGFESGVTETVDPLAGSYFVEQMTDQLEEKAWQYIMYIDSIGNCCFRRERGFIQDEIAKASYDFQKKMELGQKGNCWGEHVCGTGAKRHH